MSFDPEFLRNPIFAAWAVGTILGGAGGNDGQRLARGRG